MREYGKVKTSFWANRKARTISDDAKLLLVYLIACPHGNSIGCFVLPLGYITEDMGWSAHKATEKLEELSRAGFIERDEETRVTRLATWWEHNTIENGNVAKGAVTLAENLPSCLVSKRAIDALIGLSNPFLNGFVTRLELVSDSFVNNEPEPEPEPDTNPETDAALRAEFEIVWLSVPKKVDKEDSYREFKKAVNKDGIELVTQRIRDWARNEEGKDKQYIKSPARWLRGKHWQDEVIRKADSTPKLRVLM